MIKVLHLTSSFGLGGGAEVNLWRLVSHMDPTRFCSTIVTMTEGIGYDSLRVSLGKSRVSIYSLGMRRGVPNPVALIRLLRIIRQFEPQILQTWMYHADLLGLLAGKSSKVPFLAWNVCCSSLASSSGSGWMSKVVRRLLVLLSPIPEAVMVNSHSGLEFHRALGYRPRKWLYMPNSLDLEFFKPDATARVWLHSLLALPPQTALIGMIARLHPVKDHKTFVEVAATLASENAQVHFVLVGRGLENGSGYINDLIEATGIEDRFHLLGHRSDVNRITAGLDIACLCSLSEGSANVVTEAMACGVPCVVTDVGDSSFLLQALGRVVPPQDPKAFAQACGELLEMPESQRRELGSVARARVEECFALAKVVDRYESVYEQLATASSVS